MAASWICVSSREVEKPIEFSICLVQTGKEDLKNIYKMYFQKQTKRIEGSCHFLFVH